MIEIEEASLPYNSRVSKRGEAPLFFVPPPSKEREIKGVRLIKNSAII